MRVLLAENYTPASRALKRGLEDQSFAVDLAEDGEEADYKARSSQYDAIVLDQMLPKIDGLTLLQLWRKEGVDSHILMVSPAENSKDRIKGLDLGADDYLAKPFNLEELLSRLRALLRRDQRAKESVLRVHDLEIDSTSRAVKRAGVPIHLTPREFALLQMLAQHRGKVVTRAMIWQHLYDQYDENTSNVVDVYIRYLRTKIDKGHAKALILTRWGEGYTLRNEDE